MILAVLVIFSHSYPLASGVETREPFLLLTAGQATGGHIAVDLFFVISGFLITASYERSRSIGIYLKNRVLRIYPAFVTAMCVCCLVVMPLAGGHMNQTSHVSQVLGFLARTAQLKEFIYIGAFSTNPYPFSINGSVWSIPFEFWCYIGIALLGLSGALRSTRFMIGLFSFAVCVGVLFSIYQWAPGGGIAGLIFGYPPFWARLLPMYVAGALAYRIRGRLSLAPRWIATAGALMLGAVLIPHGWPLLFPVAGTYLVLAAAFHPAMRLRGWNRFGDFSYGTYLYAFPVQQLVMRWIGHATAPWKLFCVSSLLTLCCAAGSWHLVEKWFLRARNGSAARARQTLLVKQ